MSAYVVFELAGSADKATASNGEELAGYVLRVDSASGAAHARDVKRAVVVGNLPYGMLRSQARKRRGCLIEGPT